MQFSLHIRIVLVDIMIL